MRLGAGKLTYRAGLKIVLQGDIYRKDKKLHFTFSYTVSTYSVHSQEHQRVEESNGKPGGGRLLPAAARLCHHRGPHRPASGYQLCLQVAVSHSRETDHKCTR